MRNTVESHPDYFNIAASIEAINSLVEDMNEKKRFAENQAKVISINNSISWAENEVLSFIVLQIVAVLSCVKKAIVRV
jgi:hypothetical protein